MKFLAKTFQLLIIVFVLSLIVDAQDRVVSLSSGGFPTVNGEKAGTPLSSQSPNGTSLSANLNFGDLTPLGTTRRISIIMPVRISARSNYKIEMQRMHQGNQGLSPKDIGFGIVNARPMASDSTLMNSVKSVTFAKSFGKNVLTSPVTNGIPKFEATLADIEENPTIIMTGFQTTSKNNLDENESSILVDFVFVIVPQYFTPTDSLNMLLTISISPLE